MDPAVTLTQIDVIFLFNTIIIIIWIFFLTAIWLYNCKCDQHPFLFKDRYQVLRWTLPETCRHQQLQQFLSVLLCTDLHQGAHLNWNRTTINVIVTKKLDIIDFVLTWMTDLCITTWGENFLINHIFTKNIVWLAYLFLFMNTWSSLFFFFVCVNKSIFFLKIEIYLLITTCGKTKEEKWMISNWINQLTLCSNYK